MLEFQRHRRAGRIGHPLEGVALEGQVAADPRIEIGEGGVDALDPLDIALDRAEHVLVHLHLRNRMAAAIGLDDDEVERGQHVAGEEDITGDGEAAERELRTEIGLGIVLVGPFEIAIVDIVGGEDAAGRLIGKHQPRRARRRGKAIALEDVVAHHQVVVAEHDPGQPETLKAVVADLGVVGIDVERHRAAVHRGQALIG